MMARLEQDVKETAFRNYVTDSLQILPQRKYIAKRYAELVDFTSKDTRSGDEIAAEVIEKAGLTIE